jgi:hypothetical protein
MPHRWPQGTEFVRLQLDVLDRACRHCGRRMTVCDHRRHPIFTLKGPRELICRLVKCPDRACPGHHRTVSPECEATICLPRCLLGWDVFCWVGHRRFSRHWSVPQLRAELQDTYHIEVSEDALEDAIARYQTFVTAREQDPQRLAEAYRGVDQIVLSIDGLQPEKGHETLYVIRELKQKRIWFGEALVSSSADEVRRLIALARQWAERLGKRVELWMSDKQDAFVSGIAAEFPGVPHRYCQNHFLRDVAKSMLEEDSHAKVKMRSKVRGLRAIERDTLQSQRTVPAPGVVVSTTPAVPQESSTSSDPEAEVVLDYCTTVKGILNNDQGGPLHPPGIRMAEALQSVRQSLERNLQAKKGGARKAR